jgi:hypothetical protein
MSQVWSEVNKVVNVLDPASQSGTSGAEIATDIVNLKNYKKLTYVIHTGAAAANIPVVTLYGGETSTGATTAITFKYRTQVVGTGGNAATSGSDVSSALTDATVAGFALGTGEAGGVYIIEVDPSTVCAADTTDQTYDHVKLMLTNVATVAAQIYGVLAILSEPRYPEAILVTAID